jgi:hypothetical protein
MNKELFDKLNELNDLALSIDAKTKSINERLDELIKALHDYDDDQLHCEYSGLPSVKAYDEPKGGPCVKHDEASWDEEHELNKRIDIIGQNGNTGIHYVTNEEADEDAATMFNDYGERVGKDKDNNNTQTKHTGEKKRNKRKYYKPKPKQ